MWRISPRTVVDIGRTAILALKNKDIPLLADDGDDDDDDDDDDNYE